MSAVLPEGEDLRKAILWVSEARCEDPGAALIELVEKACIKFDLSPRDESFLLNFFTKDTK